MLIKQEKRLSPFEKFMLVQEADDETPKNRKVINLKASDGRRQNLMDGADMMDENPAPEEEPAEDTTDTPEDGAEPVMDDTDYTGDDTGEDAPEEPTTDDAETADTGEDDLMDGADMMDATPDDPGGETDDTATDTEGDTTDTPEDGAEPVMDDTDYTGDDTEGDTTDTGDTTEADGTNSDGGGEEASNDEQIRKYVLYRKFLKLNKTLDKQCEALNTLISDDIDINQKYKKISNNLKELNSLLSEYMIIRFQNASYIQSMLFYQRVLTATDINLNALMDIKKRLNKNASKTAQH